ncbi:MAG: hypothetical protein M1827_002942 [Pycnora praestabilis]|nr:MAG: hypothetical protein M1827_002942 [Pycnora praestabilis]
MAPRPRFAVATNAVLPHSYTLPSSSAFVFKTFSKISRSSLLSLTLVWLRDTSQRFCAPYLASDEGEDENNENSYPAAQSLEELREAYRELESRKGGKREVVDRVLEGDWRHGITLYQLAMVDVRHLLDHPASQRWAALKLQKVTLTTASAEDRRIDLEASTLPRLHAQTFLQNLKEEVGPVVKAHYYLTRPKSLPLTLLRIHMYDSPYNTPPTASKLSAKQTLSDGSRTIYVAFPDGSPAVYVSLGQTAGGEGRSLRKVVIDVRHTSSQENYALPKALSKPQARYNLKTTSLAARSLSALLELRGPGRSNGSAGGWSVFAEGTVEGSPLDDTFSELNTSRHSEKRKALEGVADNDQHRSFAHGSSAPSPLRAALPDSKRCRLIAEGRFGESGIEDDGKGIERLDIRIDDFFPSISTNGIANQVDTIPSDHENQAHSAENFEEDEPRSRGRKPRPSLFDEIDLNDEGEGEPASGWTPEIQLTFHGTHVFAGIRSLVESGVINGEKMPGWLTGEVGISIGVVKNGRIMGDKGASTETVS